MMYSRFVILVVIALLFGTTALHAGGWTRKEGKGYYKVEARVLRATRLYDADGRRIPIPTYSEYTGSFYGEQGLTDRLTIIAQLPFIKRVTLNRQVGRTSGIEYSPALERFGIGDAELGIRYGILQEGPTVLAGSLLVGLPTGDASSGGGLSTGDGEANAIIGLESGHSFYPAPLYATASVGFNARSKGYSDEIRWAAELGGSFQEDLQLSARVHAVHPLFNGTDESLGRSGINSNNQRYIAYGATAGYRVAESIHLVAGMESAFAARNVLAAPSFSLGISLVR